MDNQDWRQKSGRSSQSRQEMDPPYKRDEDDGVHVVQVVRTVVVVDEERQETYWTRKKRMKFVRIVYGILSIMLLVNALFVVLALFVEPINHYLRGPEGLIIYIVFSLVFFATYISLICCKTCRIDAPQNYILLTIMTLSMGIMLAGIAAHHSWMVILYATVGTLLVAILVTIIAVCGTWDVTGYGIYIFIATMVLMVGGLIILIVCLFGLCGNYKKVMWLVVSVLFVLLFAMYLLHDTQLLIGGGQVQLSSNEYILGAIHLWIDIVNIFMCLSTVCSIGS